MGAKDPHARYQSARDVVKALRSWLPVAQQDSLGLSLERPNLGALTATRLPKPPAPEKEKGGIVAFVRRLFGR